MKVLIQRRAVMDMSIEEQTCQNFKSHYSAVLMLLKWLLRNWKQDADKRPLNLDTGAI